MSRGARWPLVLLLASACQEPARSTGANPLDAAIGALARGDIVRAEEWLARARASAKPSGALLLWSAQVDRMRGRLDAALDRLRLAARTEDRAGLAQAELSGRIGDLLFEMGRHAEAAPYLDGGAVGEEAQRRAAFAAIARALPVTPDEPLTRVAEQLLRAGDLPALVCECNGKERPLVLDTGASFTTLSRSLARELGVTDLLPAGRGGRDGLGGTFAIEAGWLHSFALGSARIGPLPVLVVDDARLALRDSFGGPPEPPAGIVGLDVLMRLRVTFDPERRSVLLAPRGALGDSESVPCLRIHSGLVAPALVEGREFWFVIDTGASHSSLSEQGLAALPGGVNRASVHYRPIRAPGGREDAVRVVAGLTIAISEVSFSSLELPVVRRPNDPEFPVHGVLGADLLVRCRTTLERGRIRMEAR